MKKTIKLDKERIKNEMKYWRIPGAAAVLIQDGEPDEIVTLGWRDAERRLEVTEDTQFCIASCSKSMTAAMIASLACEGVLDVDEPIRTYVPEMKMWDEETSQNMTLRDMLCHRTGLGGYDIIWPNEEGRAVTAGRLRYLQPNKPFRSVSQYSNLIYAMAGYVAEKATGRTWEELMKKYIFDPLSMDRTTCTAAEITSDPNHAEPYQVISGELTRLSFWNVDMAGPAASVNSTARDMAKWLHFHIDGGKDKNGKQLLSKELFRQMHEPQISFVDRGRPDADCYSCFGYGMGWKPGMYRGVTMQKHTGKIEGYSTMQFYLPEERIGIILLINLHSPSNPFFYSLVYSMLDRIFGLKEIDWSQRFRIGDAAEKQEYAPDKEYNDLNVDLAADILREGNKSKDFPGDPGDWAGDYAEPGYGPLKIEKKEEPNGTVRLWLTYRDQTLPLAHWGGEQFVMEGVKADILTMRVPVTLTREGDAHCVDVRYEPLVPQARFRRTHP